MLVFLTKLFGTLDALGLNVSFDTIFSLIDGLKQPIFRPFHLLESERTVRAFAYSLMCHTYLLPPFFQGKLTTFDRVKLIIISLKCLKIDESDTKRNVYLL